MKTTSVKIRRAEGPSNLCRIWKEFKSIKNANSWIASQMNTYPKVGYDKHDYIVTFEDGSTYEGRLDCQHIENQYFSKLSNDIYESATSFLIYCLNHNGYLNNETEKEEARALLGYFQNSVLEKA